MNQILWELDHVTLLGRQRSRVQDVTLEIRAGVTAVVGYSGAGKTSLLNLLIGFERPDEGHIRSTLPEQADRIGLFWVPQNEGLWPHLTVEEHLKVVLPSGGESDERASHLLAAFDLRENRKDAPNRLSQGERARLSVARALASGAAVLVLDEPLLHVDPARLEKYRQAVRTCCTETETSVVIATHSPETVLTEATRAVCLHEGRVLFEGEVDELYYRPQSEQLATFLGPANWISAEDAGNWFDQRQHGDRCIRPEQLLITPADDSPLVVESSRFAGSVAEVDLLNEQNRCRRRFFHRPSGNRLRAGDRVSLSALLLLCLCLWLVGCDESQDPELAVRAVRYWSMPAEGRRLPAPRSITAGPDDKLYVLDNAGRVLVFNQSGELNRQWKMPEFEVGNPEAVCVFKDGRIAVADTHYHRIVFFQRGGKLLGMLGKLGREPGQFIYPVAITQDDDENFYVGEYGSNDRIQKFSREGKYVLDFGSFGTGPGQFQRPSGIVWHEGRIYVADAINNRIQVFSDSGEFQGILGSTEKTASLHYPYDLVRSNQGELFAVEYGAGRITQLDLSGRLLGRFGSVGRGENQFLTPWGLTVTDNGRVFVADTGNRRIVELRL